jgi:polyisoprenoid-binding protein YceI
LTNLKSAATKSQSHRIIKSAKPIARSIEGAVVNVLMPPARIVPMSRQSAFPLRRQLRDEERSAMSAARMRWVCLMVMTACFLTACASLAPTRVPGQGMAVPAIFPEAFYRQAEARGIKVLRVDPVRSLVVVEVRRAGALARLGHDHVIASHDVSGYVAPEEGRADLYVPLARLTVDESEMRVEAGFDTQTSMDAIEGTRRNMLEKVLEAERFPYALIHIDRSTADGSMLRVTVTLHSMTRTFEIPAQIENPTDGMVVNGRLTFNQTDFGIVPFSVLGGALQVQDRVDLRFRIVAVR